MSQHLVGLRVIQRQAIQIEGNAKPLQQPLGALQDGQRGQAEEVEFHQSRLLDVLHRVLRDQQLRPRIAIQRHQLDQRAIADHHAGGVRRGVAIQPLELQGDLQQALNAFVLVAQLGQPRLAVDRLLQRHRRGRDVGDQLGDAVHLAERQAEHAPHVAHHGARLQLAEGDDLRDPVGAVFVTYIVDDRVAALLAEIDVEIRHRHAFRVQEALEQQVEAQRIDVGDGQRPGGDGTGPRAAAGADGDPLAFRPLDEVGDDQKVAGEAHAGDDIQLVVQPLAIPVARRRVGRHRVHAAIQALTRHGTHGGFLAAAGTHLGRDRQHRLAAFRHHRAAPRDRQRVVAGLRQIGEQRAHVGGRLEPMLRGDAPAILFRQQAGLGDAQQGVMRLEHRRGGEEAVVGGNQRQVRGVGQGDQAGFDGVLQRQAVAMQFDRAAIGEGLSQAGEQRFGLVLLALGEQACDRAVGAAGEQDQPGRVAGEHIERKLRLEPGVGLQETSRRQALQVRQTGRVLRKQHQRIGRQAGVVGAGQRDLAADDRLDALGGAGLAELQRAEQVAGVGDGDRGHPGRARQDGDLIGLDGALAERIGGMDAQMDEIGVGHGGSMGTGAESGQGRCWTPSHVRDGISTNVLRIRLEAG